MCKHEGMLFIYESIFNPFNQPPYIGFWVECVECGECFRVPFERFKDEAFSPQEVEEAETDE